MDKRNSQPRNLMEKTMSKSKHVNLISVVLVNIFLVATLALVSCSNANTTETNTPLGCFKNKARYYDPKTKLCVQVNDWLQAQVLNNYRYLDRLIEVGAYDKDDRHLYKLEEGNFAIYFKNYLKISEASPYWDELRAKGAKMDQLLAQLPANRQYDVFDSEDLNRYKEGAKIWSHGQSDGCGWKDTSGKNSSAKPLLNIIEDGIAHKEGYTKKANPEKRHAVFQENDCRVDYMIVKASPELMLDFWNNHLSEDDQLLAIQPRVELIDGTAPQLGPRRDLTE